MKTLFSVVLSLLILLGGQITVTAQVAKQIAGIRGEVNLINKSAPKYAKTTRQLEGISLEGTEATYFTSGRGLKKIVAKIFGETFRSTAELYFSGEELIFVFRRLERYDTQIGMSPPPKVAKVDELRLYRGGGKTIRILDGKTQLKTGTIQFDEAEYELIELADMLKSGYRF